MGFFNQSSNQNPGINVNIIGDTTNRDHQPNSSTNYQAEEFWQRIETIITAKVASAHKPKTSKENKEFGDLIIKTGSLILISLIILFMLSSILWVYIQSSSSGKEIPEFTKTLFTSISTIVAGIVGFLFGGKK
ncbi:hypothetical protein HFD92_21345 [Pantoea sp. EKM101V]|uniref:hypothetical protein n=1 Tax=Pantoea sp. EKM101V TaxID=1683695 RepID=UPI00142E7FD4|nr:hypothetical protein [Pantoea sp. EKM101V]KAF6658361.1 hypothetical protein HFD92_21345 [Pantoea sp. EKM101V]